MANFAEIDNNNVVLRVLRVPDEQEHRGHDFMANDLGLGGTWLQTSYNKTIRKNYAGIGYTYDPNRDAFIAPKPDNALGFDEDTCQWITPELDNAN
jgi:hypothetical protein